MLGYLVKIEVRGFFYNLLEDIKYPDITCGGLNALEISEFTQVL